MRTHARYQWTPDPDIGRDPLPMMVDYRKRRPRSLAQRCHFAPRMSPPRAGLGPSWSVGWTRVRITVGTESRDTKNRETLLKSRGCTASRP
jgi:hypothetical protein